MRISSICTVTLLAFLSRSSVQGTTGLRGGAIPSSSLAVPAAPTPAPSKAQGQRQLPMVVPMVAAPAPAPTQAPQEDQGRRRLPNNGQQQRQKCQKPQFKSTDACKRFRDEEEQEKTTTITVTTQKNDDSSGSNSDDHGGGSSSNTNLAPPQSVGRSRRNSRSRASSSSGHGQQQQQQQHHHSQQGGLNSQNTLRARSGYNKEEARRRRKEINPYVADEPTTNDKNANRRKKQKELAAKKHREFTTQAEIDVLEEKASEYSKDAQRLRKQGKDAEADRARKLRKKALDKALLLKSNMALEHNKEDNLKREQERNNPGFYKAMKDSLTNNKYTKKLPLKYRNKLQGSEDNSDWTTKEDLQPGINAFRDIKDAMVKQIKKEEEYQKRLAKMIPTDVEATVHRKFSAMGFEAELKERLQERLQKKLKKDQEEEAQKNKKPNKDDEVDTSDEDPLDTSDFIGIGEDSISGDEAIDAMNSEDLAKPFDIINPNQEGAV